MTTLEGKADMEFFALAQMIARLRLETKTGLTFKVSTMKVAHYRYNLNCPKSKKATLKALEDLYEERYGRRYGECETDSERR